MLGFRMRDALLAGLRDRPVADLSEATLQRLGLAVMTRTVMISAERHGHIILRRQLAAQVDAEAPALSANRIADALRDLRYRRATRRSPTIWDVIGYVQGASRHLQVSIKVPSVPSRDQMWVQTAFPVGHKTLRKLLRTGEFVAMDAS